MVHYRRYINKNNTDNKRHNNDNNNHDNRDNCISSKNNHENFKPEKKRCKKIWWLNSFLLYHW